MEDSRRIRFKFHPLDFEKNLHAVEKSINGGQKRRYLMGVSSGEKLDGHGERMTQKCIKSFMDQANRGAILLYADRHDVNYTDDIGILSGARVLNDGDWETTFRLYDQEDGLGDNTIQKADKLWRQVNGLAPYPHPLQKGFSVEGYIPDDGIVEMSEDGRRVMDNVVLDGVVVVPRPAYTTSIAHAVYKALGLKRIWNVEKGIRGRFSDRLREKEVMDNFFSSKYGLDDALMDEIYNFMQDQSVDDKREILESIFDEYKQMMIELILNSSPVFQDDKNPDNPPSVPAIVKMDMDNGKNKLMKEFVIKLREINKIISVQH